MPIQGVGHGTRAVAPTGSYGQAARGVRPASRVAPHTARDRRLVDVVVKRVRRPCERARTAIAGAAIAEFHRPVDPLHATALMRAGQRDVGAGERS